MEISFPSYPKFNIYADTETFTLLPPGATPWTETDVTKRNELLKTLQQVPWLLVWTHRWIDKQDNKYVIKGDWFTDYCYIAENNFEPFFEDLRRIYANKHIPVIHFHNASYDLSCIFNIWQRLDPGLIVYFYTKPGNYNFLMGEIESPKYKFKAKFEDTMLYLGKISIDQMGEELGYPKIKGVPYAMADVELKDGKIIYIDRDDGETKTYPLEQYLEYAERDVEIMRRYDEYLSKVKDSVGRTVIDDDKLYESSFKKNIWSKTQASHSKSLCNAYLRRNGYKTSIDEACRFEVTQEAYQYIGLSNIGGFTSFNENEKIYRCKEDEEIRYFDMNSMYPTVITEGIPWKPLLNNPPVDTPYTTWKLISVYDIKWNSLMDFNKTQLIPGEKTTKPDSPKPTKLYVTQEYLDLMKKYTSVLDIKEYHTVYQEKTKCFKKFVEDLYRKRVLLKRELKQLKEQPRTHENLSRIEQLSNQQTGIKIVLNSLYGKFCEKPHHNRCFYSNLSDFKYVRYPIDNPKYRSILSGAYIIYEARLKLLDKIIKCVEQGWKVLYADTDSVIFVCPKSADHTIVFGTDEGWLGQWKLEGKFNIFVNNGVKKKYFLMDSNNPANYRKAMSGVNKEFVKALEKQLDAGNKQTIEDIIFIFDPKNNVVLRKLKKNKVRTHVYNQTIIYESDYTFNGDVEINGEIIVKDGEYKLIKYGQQD